MPEDLLTVEEVASYLKIDQRTVYRMLAQKQLPAFKVGGQWRFYRTMIDAWLKNNSNIPRNVQKSKSVKSAAQTADESVNVDQVNIKKALIVEDHLDMLYILTRFLKTLGFTVFSATHGAEGVEKAAKEKPQIILMDILLPGMDGREATRRIRSNPETKDIPILAATVLNNGIQLKTCIEAGCNDYLVKPFTMQQLQGKIQALIPTSSTATH